MQQTDIEHFRSKAVPAQGHWISGKAVSSEQSLAVESPLDGKSFTTIAAGTASDVDLAVASARKAFESGVWSKAAPSERKKKLLKLAELIEKNALELAVLGVRDNGTEISMAYKAEPLSAAGTFRYYAEAVDKVLAKLRQRKPMSWRLCTRSRLALLASSFPGTSR